MFGGGVLKTVHNKTLLTVFRIVCWPKSMGPHTHRALSEINYKLRRKRENTCRHDEKLCAEWGNLSNRVFPPSFYEQGLKRTVAKKIFSIRLLQHSACVAQVAAHCTRFGHSGRTARTVLNHQRYSIQRRCQICQLFSLFY